MPSAQFFIDLHEYINREMRLFYPSETYSQRSVRFYMALQEMDTDRYSLTHIREFWGRTPYDVQEFLLMELDIVRFMAEDDEPLSPPEFAQYWRSLDQATKSYYRSNFPRH